MRILTWNVLNKNKNVAGIKHCLDAMNADVVALQELTPEHISAIEDCGYENMILARDFSEEGEITYLGLYSKFGIMRHGSACINIANKNDSPISKFMGWNECLDFQWAEVRVYTKSIFVVNLHLSAGASPTYRSNELSNIYSNLPDDAEDNKIVVLCGDFNAFAKPIINIFIGPLFGYAAIDYAQSDLLNLEKWASLRNFHLIRNRHATYRHFRIANLVLDHFMIKGEGATKIEVMRNSYGSDHFPVVLELEV